MKMIRRVHRMKIRTRNLIPVLLVVLGLGIGILIGLLVVQTDKSHDVIAAADNPLSGKQAQSGGTGNQGSQNNSGTLNNNSGSGRDMGTVVDGDGISREMLVYAEDWEVVLVNGDNPIEDGFVPELAPVEGGYSYNFDIRAVDALDEMLSDARAEGLNPLVCSAYRSVETQTTLFEQSMANRMAQGLSEEDARNETAKSVQIPGHSEHNLGLAVDIVSYNYQMLDKAQEETAEYIWFSQNCHKYGFIVRYPEDKQHITGIIYEPWHFRYVGVAVATEIMEQGICLEEYLGVY